MKAKMAVAEAMRCNALLARQFLEKKIFFFGGGGLRFSCSTCSNFLIYRVVFCLKMSVLE